LYLDQGIQAVEAFFEPFMSRAVVEIMVDGHPRDPKSLLQEWTQARSLAPPEYETVKESGPDHDKVFTVEVVVQDMVRGVGQGNSKRQASKEAARDALEKLSQINNSSNHGG
jgi:ribonuclease-3